MNNSISWSFSSYSVYRILLGTYLLVHFASLIPWAGEVFGNGGLISEAGHSPFMNVLPNLLAWSDHPLTLTVLLGIACIASISLILGRLDRLSAILMAVILAWLYQRNPLIANPSLPLVGWMLVAHSLLPRRFDELPKSIWYAAWIVLAVAYTYSGYTKLLSPSWVSGDTISYVLQNPLARDHWLRELVLMLPPIFLTLLTWAVLYVELLFAPLALFRKIRPWVWLTMLIVQFGFLIFLNFADLTIPMLLIHLLTFDPNWLRVKESATETIFYDGNCGFCHRVIQFVLREDREQRYQFSPLQSSVFAQQALDHQSIPDSFVIHTTKDEYLTQGKALRHLLLSLGGVWRLLGGLLKIIPHHLLTLGYRCIAAVRHRLFPQPDGLCPVVSPSDQQRFLLGGLS